MAIKTARLPSDQFRARGYRTISTPFFLLKTKKNLSDKARVGVVVGVSVHKTAVKRNFLKRQVLAELAPRARAGSDILTIVLPAANHVTKRKFREELAKAFAGA
jgi:ribonuclease P protein component